MEPMALEAASTDASSMSVASALIGRARRGDQAAFEILLRERMDRLFQTASVILGNESDARDAVQETCLSVWRNLPRLRDPEIWSRRLADACARQRVQVPAPEAITRPRDSYRARIRAGGPCVG